MKMHHCIDVVNLPAIKLYTPIWFYQSWVWILVNQSGDLRCLMVLQCYKNSKLKLLFFV